MNTTDGLFTPFRVGTLELENRIVMAPMTRNQSPGSVVNDKVVDYYRRRAEGGVGLIITEGTWIGHKAAAAYPHVPAIYGDAALAGWQKVVDAVHGADSKIAAQLWHAGGLRRPGLDSDEPGHSPSGMASPGKITGHAMSREDIAEVVAAYAQAAKDAKAIGFDAIEIHAAHGYLIDQFFWADTNLRDDEYGGDLAQRSRFVIEVIKACRAAVGPDFPVSLRLSQWKQQDYNARLVETPQELATFLKPLSEAGVDIFHCSLRRFWEPEFAGSELNLAGWARKLTGKPAIAVGSVGLDADFINEGDSAEFESSDTAGLDNLIQRMNNQEFDLIAVGRALIANPDWVNKVRNNQLSELNAFDKDMLKTLF